jgi:hypothetical protein
LTPQEKVRRRDVSGSVKVGYGGVKSGEGGNRSGDGVRETCT